MPQARREHTRGGPAGDVSEHGPSAPTGAPH